MENRTVDGRLRHSEEEGDRTVEDRRDEEGAEEK